MRRIAAGPATCLVVLSAALAFLDVATVTATPPARGGAASAPDAPEVTVALGASKDNTLYESATGALSNGAGEHFFAGRVGAMGGGAIRRGLVAFDVAAGVPAGATITSARLTLNMSQTIVGTQTVTLQRVLADWGEGASDAPVEEGAGTAPAVGDATWIHRFFATSLWTAAGGDFAVVASASQSVNAAGAYTWGSSAGMVADAQAWLDSPASNFGWVVRADETTFPTAKRFDSRQHATASRRPVLAIEYTPGGATSTPTPTSLPSATATAVATATPSPSATATGTPPGTPSSLPPSATPETTTPTSTNEPTATGTPPSTETASPTDTATPTGSPTVTASATATDTAAPSITPTPTGSPTSTATVTPSPVSTATPPPVPTGSGPVPQACGFILNRVPPQVIVFALANPDRISGWGQLANAGVPPSPFNRLRTWLSLQNIGAPFHPLFNSVVYKAGCP